MFKNYLKIALRNIKRHKGLSFINVMGLAVGNEGFISITALVEKELSSKLISTRF
jgi:putative ABC transport system permease protein